MKPAVLGNTVAEEPAVKVWSALMMFLVLTLAAAPGGLLGEATILPISTHGGSGDFIALGGRIPAPIQSLTN